MRRATRQPIFRNMADVLSPATSGTVVLDHFEINEDSGFRPIRDGIPHGRYARLREGNVLWMTDTPFEHRTNYGVVYESRGRVLIGGLGLGMVLLSIARKPEVSSVVVVERSADIIETVWPQIRSALGRRLARNVTVVHGDIWEWRPAREDRFDTMYFDIWADVTTDSLAADGWVGHWCRDILRDRRTRERRLGW